MRQACAGYFSQSTLATHCNDLGTWRLCAEYLAQSIPVTSCTACLLPHRSVDMLSEIVLAQSIFKLHMLDQCALQQRPARCSCTCSHLHDILAHSSHLQLRHYSPHQLKPDINSTPGLSHCHQDSSQEEAAQHARLPELQHEP